jgi:beta-1,3-galactosyltransferase / beta-1,3-N-acetylglucosaminyltransferase
MRFRRRMIKRKSITKILYSLVLLYFCYLFGLFTHVLEKDFSGFSSSNSAEIPDFPNKNFDINNLNYKFLYESKETCVNNRNELIILVKSKLSHFEQRKSIRLTWGDKTKNLISLVFLLGIPSPDEYPDIGEEHHQIDDQVFGKKNSREIFSSDTLNLNEKLKAESRIYNDIVQQNFYDTYYNNTLKAIRGLQWIDRYCSDAAYYLFIDDDYYLNPKILIKYLNENIKNNETLLNNLYAGFVFKNSSPMRHQFSKWYISLEEYPYHKFPPYVSAGCYILTKNSAKLFYKATKLITLFRFDDIYLGILAFKLKIEPLNVEQIYFYPPEFDYKNYAESIIASHGFSTSLLLDTWKKIYK